jgi:hypothetical protein
MAQLTAERIKNALTSLFSSADSTDVDLMKKLLFRKTAVGYFTDGGTAGTAQTTTAFFVNETGKPVKVTSCKLVVPVAVTGHAANYATVTVAHRTSAGASATTIASYVTDTPTTDDLVAFAPEELTITAANAVVPAGGVVTVACAKASSGVAMAAATSQAYVSIEYEPVDS